MSAMVSPGETAMAGHHSECPIGEAIVGCQSVDPCTVNSTIATDKESNVEKCDDASTSINELPDELLCLIMKSLTVRDVVRSSVLSHRWRGLWMFLADLRFDEAGVLKELPSKIYLKKLSTEALCTLLTSRNEKFVRSVSKFLQHHVGIGVRSFKVHFPLNCEHQEAIDGWVNFASMSGAREMEFIFSGYYYGSDPYKFPLHFISIGSASHLRSLHLGHCLLSVPHGLVSFSSLESLELQEVDIQEEDFHRLLSRCSVLERLYIRDCSGVLANLRIYNVSARLKVLIVECCDLESLMVSAANLVEFAYVGEAINIDLMDVPKLERASVQLDLLTDQFDIYSVHSFLTHLSTWLTHLKTLKLIFPYDPYDKIHVLPPCSHVFTNLRFLVVRLYVTVTDNLLPVASFLNIAPFLEKLEVDMHDYRCKGTPGEAPRPFEFPHKYLKEVVISGFAGYSNHIELARFFLQSVLGLRVMTFNLCVRHANIGGSYFSPIRGKRAKRLRQKTLKQLRPLQSSATLLFFPALPSGGDGCG